MLGYLSTLLLVSAVSAPNVSATNPNGYFYLESGGYLAGEVVSDDGSHVRIKLRGTSEVETRPHDVFTSKTRYKLRSYQMDEKSGTDHLALGDFALSQGLHLEAARHYRAALRHDTSLWEGASQGLEKVRVAAATARLDEVARAIKNGEFAQVHRELIELGQDQNPQVALRAAALMEAFPDLTRSRSYLTELSFPALGKVRALYDRAAKSNRDGLLHTGTSSRSARDYRAAARDIKRALRTLDKIRAKQDSDGLFDRAALDLERDLLELFAATALNQSSMHVVQQSFRKALTVINEAMAYDPNNVDLLNARTRVEQAVSSASGALVGTL